MALNRFQEKIVLLVSIALLFFGAHATHRGLNNKRIPVFDVTNFGARANGKTDCSIPFIRAWVAACHANGPAKVVIPPGNYKAGEVFFQGPCDGHITVEVHGSIVSSRDLPDFVNGIWFLIRYVDGFTLDGANFQASFNGSGDAFWKYYGCPVGEPCDPFPPNFSFINVTNADVGFLSSIDSKGYHFMIEDSSNVHLHDLKMQAPSDSPQTNGVYVVSSDHIQVTKSIINTGGGKDCVIWGPHTKDYVCSQVSCNRPSKTIS